MSSVFGKRALTMKAVIISDATPVNIYKIHGATCHKTAFSCTAQRRTSNQELGLITFAGDVTATEIEIPHKQNWRHISHS